MFERAQENIIKEYLFKGKVLVIYGARQVGKTTLLKKILSESKKQTNFIDCELLSNRKALEDENIEYVRKFLGNAAIIVLDEAQKVKNIGPILKILHDHYPELQIIASGSSSFDLAKHTKEPLTGRSHDFLLYPISYEELSKTYSFAALQQKIEGFLRYGMYPEVLLQQDTVETIRLLDGIAGNYLYKDILEFENIRKSDLLTDLLQLLALQIGNEVSYNEVARQLGINVVTVQKYIELLEKSFIIFRLRGFSRNLRNEISKSVKIYFWDLGIRNSLIKNFNELTIRSDTGALWENFCITERMKSNQYHQRFVNSYFWRTYEQKEIDYIEESGGILTAFEMKWKAGSIAKLPKEFDVAYPGSIFDTVTPMNIDTFLL